MQTSAKLFLIGALLIFFFSGTGTEAKMVSTNQEVVNIRSAPSTSSPVRWQLGKGFPLKVISSSGNWYKVSDFEKDAGWIYAPLTSSTAHLIVKTTVVNLRSGPGTSYRIIGKAKYGVVFRTLKRVKGWVKVQHKSGLSGWVARRLLWGW